MENFLEKELFYELENNIINPNLEKIKNILQKNIKGTSKNPHLFEWFYF